MPETRISSSARLKGKASRVRNMLVENHLRPAAKQVIEIPDGHRFGFPNLRHALTSFLMQESRKAISRHRSRSSLDSSTLDTDTQVVGGGFRHFPSKISFYHMQGKIDA
jgi:integrase